MSLNKGGTLLHYRLVEKLGEGGMGVVWTAADTSLERDVAIKVLPEELGSHGDRLARFEREAKLLASLNHPNIAAVYGLHQGAEGERFIAMELVPGEDLAKVLQRGPLGVDRALAFATQIAEALEAAHEHGIIHRDLKPANVVVTPDDRIKVLDFGLAKSFDPDPGSGSASPSISPTLTSAGTEAGVILGTAAYMAPEQARGRVVDKRADIWAFGCLLYEMLTGMRAFGGETVSDTLAAVLTARPDQEELPSGTPAAVRRLIARCTEKDPRRRLRDIGEARIALEDARAGSSESEVGTGGESPKQAFSHRLPWIAAAGAALVALLMTFLYVLQTGAPNPTVGRFAIEYPYTQGQRYGDGRALAISPDGDVIVTSAAGGSDDLLYYRRIDEYEARQISSAGAGRLPFFSPDGKWIGFVTPQGVWKINLAGGPPTKLGSVTAFTVGATWSTNGSLYLTSSQQLWRLPENGGEGERIDVEGFGSQGVGNPWAMPSGKTLLLSVGQREDAKLIALDLETNTIQELGLQGSDPRYLPTGHLIYTHANQVLAVRFDARKLTPLGTPVPVLPRVRIDGNTMQLAFSANGTAVYLPADERSWRRLVMVDLDGRADPVFEESMPFSDNNDPRFSPDGSKIALSESAGPIWVIDLESGAPIKLSDSGFYPLWSPDGSLIAYGTSRSTSFDLMMRPLDMSQPERVLLDRDINLRTADWAQDGALIIRQEIPGKGMDLMRWTDLQDESSIDVLLDGDEDEVSPAVSPDGRWLAYVSDQSGRDEVYVTAYPKSEGVVQISVAGGANPAWSTDGREIYYFQGREFIAVTVGADRGLKVVGRRTLFEGDIRQYRWQRQYDVHPDGKHFVMIEDPPGGHLEVILNWFTELDQTLDRGN
jgi:Tol biopolymer transport system component/predicted Ser/Thr protein kinase